MPRNPTTGDFVRVSNTFSEPIYGAVIDPTDANSLFDDYDVGLTFDDASPLILIGSTSGVTTIKAADTASGTITLPAGTTDFSATGGTGQFVRQDSAGAPFTVTTVPASEISSGAALTKVDDTNVTLSLGGSPTVALLAATSITAGWTGTLAANRLNGNVVQAVTNDTNVTGTVATQTLTLGWTGQLSLARGGTNANLTASNGGIFYSTASAGAILSGTATASLPLLSGSSATPSWATIRYPTSATSGGIPYFSSTSVMGSSSLLAANQIVLGGGAGTAPATLGSLGTTTTVLHGNAAGAPTFGAVSLTADITGTLGVSNGGTGVASQTAYSVVCAGTTSTGAYQNATIGTAGRVLMDNGAAALPTFQTLKSTVQFVIDGGGVAIATGVSGYLLVPFACTVTSWTALADQSGSITIDILNDSYANYGTNTSMVGGGTKPAISAATKNQSAPSGWSSVSIAAGSIVGFNVTAATTVTRVTISLTVNRTSA